MEDSIKRILELLENNQHLVPVVEDAIAAYEAKNQASMLTDIQIEELELRKAKHVAGEGRSWSWEEVEQHLAELRGL